MPDLVTLPADPVTPLAQTVARHLLAGLNSELSRRVQVHQAGFAAVWDSPCPPDEILAAMGTHAAIMLGSASESVAHLARLAAMVGKQLTDFLPADQWMPRREFVPAADGTVTLAPPAEGFDAWGRPIIPAEPPQPQEPIQ